MNTTDAISLARESLSGWIAIAMGIYVILLLGVSLVASRRITGPEDFVVAGRRLNLGLATATLVATWFGAGTLMAAADEIRSVGLQGAGLDPLGAGLCLILFGLFFAKKLWNEKLLTLPEIFGRRFGEHCRRLGAFLMIPPYLGWIAAQFMALAGILTLFFELPMQVAMVAVAVFGVAYTVLGGMWAVTLTDAVQLGIVLIGLAVLTFETLMSFGGLGQLWASLPAEHRILIPLEDLPELVGWLGVVAAGALGNIPSQDVAQRVFAAQSAATAKHACLLSGLLYLVMGAAPVLLGLAGTQLDSQVETGTITQLAALSLHPAMAVVFSVTLMSVILSTIDGALLAPATVLVNDLWRSNRGSDNTALHRYRIAVTFMGAISLGLALAGENAYALLEASYELGMVSLLAPLTYALYAKHFYPPAAMSSMLVGTLLWGSHYALEAVDFLGIAGWPLGLCAMGISYGAYPLVLTLRHRLNPDSQQP